MAISLFTLMAGTHPEFQRALTVDEWEVYYEQDWNKYRHYFVNEPESDEVALTPEPETTSEPETSSVSKSSFESETSSEPETTSGPNANVEPGKEPDSEPEAETSPEPVPLPENAHVKYSYLRYIEYTCVIFFTLDLLVRFVFCPKKMNLPFSFLNWIDIFALAVTYALYIVEALNPKEKYEASAVDSLHCLQIVRVFRLFRVVKNFNGFRVLYYAFKASISEMMMMLWILFVAVLLFSTCAYFSGDDTFPSIPDSFWWVIVTMTTVGYGDVVPKLGLSKLLGALCAVAGVCLLAIIIPVFVNNFTLFYSYSKVWGKKQEKGTKAKKVQITQVKTIENLDKI